MAALGGMTDLYGGSGAVPDGQQGRDPKEWGTNPDPRHAIPGDASAAGHDYVATPYAPTVDNDDQVESTPLQGITYNETPDSHAAPYPAGMVGDVDYGQQMRELHGNDLGGWLQTYAVGTPYGSDIEAGRYDSPNSSALGAQVPAQLRAGLDDVDQGYGTTNDFGFEFGRQFRRTTHDPVPMDRTGTVRGERPFYGAHSLTPHSFDGENSPYGDVYGDVRTDMAMRPTPTGAPSPYVQPPAPSVNPAAGYAEESGFAW